MPPKSKAEIKYLKVIRDYKDVILSAADNAVQEGFEFFVFKLKKEDIPGACSVSAKAFQQDVSWKCFSL